MKGYSLSFKVVQFVFQSNENYPSYDALNGHRYSKNNEKLECLMSHFWEAIQAIEVNSLGTHMTTWATHTPNFVQF